MKTNEGAFQHNHSLDHCVEFFSKAGSIFDTPTKQTFYDNNEDILTLFQQAWITDKEITFKLLLWLRDCRGGAGNRSGFRKCMNWLAKREEDHKWINENIDQIPEVGRWDDLRSLFKTFSEKSAVTMWVDALFDGNVLAAKWSDRKDIPVYLEMKNFSEINNMGDFRRYLSKLRKDTIIESKMCKKDYSDIDYSHIPSVAMARYTSAFHKNDGESFVKYKESLSKGETTINADVLFPHDCIRTVKNGDHDIANAQFDALPNYMKSDENIMVICDSSGSMISDVSGSISAYDVSTSLALYCSGKVDKDNPFYKKFIQFESESKFSDWDGMKFSEALGSGNSWHNTGMFNRAIGMTRIDKALDLLLNTGKMFKVDDKNMPSMLLICSDMQFHQGVRTDGDCTEVESCMKRWDDAGYTRPKIVYWNLVPYSGQQATVDDKNIGLVSGFSPSILKSVLSCDDFSPQAIMLKSLEKYHVFVPE